MRLLGASVIPRGEVLGRNEEITCSFLFRRHDGDRHLIGLLGRYGQLNAFLFQRAVFNAIVEVNTKTCRSKLDMTIVPLGITAET